MASRKRAFLVYQGGLANVFEVKCHNLASYGRNAERLLQDCFSSCRWFALGLKAAGWIVQTAACNKDGDITNEKWTDDLESQPFADKLIRIEFDQGF